MKNKYPPAHFTLTLASVPAQAPLRVADTAMPSRSLWVIAKGERNGNTKILIDRLPAEAGRNSLKTYVPLSPI